MFVSLQSILPRFLNRVDRQSRVYNLSVVDILNDVLKEEWNHEIISFVKPIKYQNGNLFIKCENSSVASEIQLKKANILTKVNRRLNYLKRQGVKNIIFI